MSCPSESHRIEEFKNKKYETGSDIPNYLPNGVNIIKAVKLYSIKQENKEKMKLDELLGQTVGSSQFVDSAWGSCGRDIVDSCKSNCGHSRCRCQSDCSCDHQCRCEHCRCDPDCNCNGDQG